MIIKYAAVCSQQFKFIQENGRLVEREFLHRCRNFIQNIFTIWGYALNVWKLLVYWYCMDRKTLVILRSLITDLVTAVDKLCLRELKISRECRLELNDNSRRRLWIPEVWPLWRPNYRWEGDIKREQTERVWYSFISKQGLVAVCCAHCTWSSGFMTWVSSLYYLNSCWLLKKRSTPYTSS
jgi:hypothetical protein